MSASAVAAVADVLGGETAAVEDGRLDGAARNALKDPAEDAAAGDALGDAADALADGTAAVAEGELDGAAREAIDAPKDELGEAAADDGDGVAVAEMVADEVSCRLDGHTAVEAAKTGEQSCAGITCPIAGGGGVNWSSSSSSPV